MDLEFILHLHNAYIFPTSVAIGSGSMEIRLVNKVLVELLQLSI